MCRSLCTVDRMKTSGCANLQNVTISNSKKFCAACRSHLTFIHFVLLSFFPFLCVSVSLWCRQISYGATFLLFLHYDLRSDCSEDFDLYTRELSFFLLVPFEDQNQMVNKVKSSVHGCHSDEVIRALLQVKSKI